MHIRHRPHGLTALWVACVLGGLGQSLAGTAGTLVADRFGGAAAAGLPQALQVGSTAVAAVVLSRVTERHGRRAALASGTAVAALACVTALVGVQQGDLVLVLVGSALIGAGNSTVMLGRYAAADLAPPERRTMAMGAVLTVTTIGAVAGPNLLAPAAGVPLAGGEALAGSYAICAAAFLAATAVLRAGLPGRAAERRHDGPGVAADPVAGPVVGPSAGPAAAGIRMPSPVPGLVVLGVTNLVMIGVMTMAPVHLGHGGARLDVIGLVVSVHIAAMFGPAVLSARLTERIGARAAAVVAGGLLVGSSALAALGQGSSVALLAAMALLGLAWSVGLVAGSTMLTDGVPATARPRREGRGEFVMGVAAAVAGAGSGLVMAAGGYSAVAVVGLVCALPLLAVWGRSSRRTAGLTVD